MNLAIVRTFVFTILPLLAQAQTPTFVSDSLEGYIQKGMQHWQIPSMAVGIVQNGRIVKSRGFGVTELGKSRRVDENTLFPIASNTKLFVATVFAQLAQQKNGLLDEPVIRYIPTFCMYDSAVTPLLSIRDLLSHRIGLEGHKADFVSWNSNLTRSQLTKKLAVLKPSYPFRQQYGYSNIGYVAAGEAMKAITGRSWEYEVDSLLLKPLHMNRTFFEVTNIKDSNLARPYSTCCNVSGEVIRLPYDSLATIGAATGMVSCLKDMNTWLMMQLDSGRVAGRQIIPWPTLATTRHPNTIVSTTPIPGFPIESQFYALGVSLTYYGGHQVFLHTGTSFGFRSAYCFIPDKNVGFVILSSNDNNSFYEALLFQLMDSYLQIPYTNRADYFLRGYLRRQQKAKEKLDSLNRRVEVAKPLPLPIHNFTGRYYNSLYGDINITVQSTVKGKSNLLIRFEHHPSLTAELDYMDGNEFRMAFSNPHFGIVPATFTLSSGIVKSIGFRPSEFLDDDLYEFVKQ